MKKENPFDHERVLLFQLGSFGELLARSFAPVVVVFQAALLVLLVQCQERQRARGLPPVMIEHGSPFLQFLTTVEPIVSVPAVVQHTQL